jgi:hypothetical protein
VHQELVFDNFDAFFYWDIDIEIFDVNSWQYVFIVDFQFINYLGRVLELLTLYWFSRCRWLLRTLFSF